MCEISPMWNLGTWLAPARFIIMFSWRAPATHTTHQCFAKWYRAATQFLNILLSSHYILECTSHCCRMHSLHVLYIYIYTYIYIYIYRTFAARFAPHSGLLGMRVCVFPCGGPIEYGLGGSGETSFGLHRILYFWFVCISMQFSSETDMWLVLVLSFGPPFGTSLVDATWFWELFEWGLKYHVTFSFCFLFRDRVEVFLVCTSTPPRFLQHGRRNSASDFTP